MFQEQLINISTILQYFMAFPTPSNVVIGWINHKAHTFTMSCSFKDVLAYKPCRLTIMGVADNTQFFLVLLFSHSSYSLRRRGQGFSGGATTLALALAETHKAKASANTH
jgi:hypothetical protein